MVAIKNLVFFTATASAWLIPRDAATLKKDLATVNNDTLVLTNATNAYNGGVANAVPIANAESTLDNDIKAANTDAGKSAAVSSTDAQAIIDYINKTLEPNVAAAVKAIENKKPHFDTDGLSGTVLNDLKQLKNDTDTLGASLLAKTPTAQKSAAQSALSKIDADLQGGIKFFS